MYDCMYIYRHIYTYIHTYIYIHTFIYIVYIHTYVRTYIHTCTSVNVCSKMAATSDLSFSFLNSVFIPYKYFETAAHNGNIPFLLHISLYGHAHAH